MTDNLNNGRPWLIVRCNNPHDYGPDCALIPCGAELALSVHARLAGLRQINQELVPDVASWRFDYPLFIEQPYVEEGDLPEDEYTRWENLFEDIQKQHVMALTELPGPLATIVNNQRNGLRGTAAGLYPVDNTMLNVNTKKPTKVWWSARMRYSYSDIVTEDISIEMLVGKL